jgi:hypothetical protein
MNRSTVSRWMIGGGVAVGLTVAGCAQFVRKPPAGKAPPQAIEPVAPQPRPHLAAARDQQVSVFGELPDRRDVPYFTRTGSSLLQHTFSEEGADFDPAISPDGTWMVFSSTRHNRSPDLYYKQIDGIAVTQLTSDPASDVHPVFSPDGRRVAFASNRAGNWDIWMVALDGTQAQQITSSGSDELHPSWSADGKRLVYCSLPPRGQWELWVADATDGGGHKHFFGYGLFPHGLRSRTRSSISEHANGAAAGSRSGPCNSSMANRATRPKSRPPPMPRSSPRVGTRTAHESPFAPSRPVQPPPTPRQIAPHTSPTFGWSMRMDAIA